MYYLDVEELACRALGKTKDETREMVGTGNVDELLCEKYEIGFDHYYRIVEDLLPLRTQTS